MSIQAMFNEQAIDNVRDIYNDYKDNIGVKDIINQFFLDYYKSWDELGYVGRGIFRDRLREKLDYYFGGQSS